MKETLDCELSPYSFMNVAPTAIVISTKAIVIFRFVFHFSQIIQTNSAPGSAIPNVALIRYPSNADEPIACP